MERHRVAETLYNHSNLRKLFFKCTIFRNHAWVSFVGFAESYDEAVSSCCTKADSCSSFEETFLSGTPGKVLLCLRTNATELFQIIIWTLMLVEVT